MAPKRRPGDESLEGEGRPARRLIMQLVIEQTTERENAAELARFKNALVDPCMMPNGLGTWKWLHHLDPHPAAGIGFDTAESMGLAQTAGRILPRQGASVVFWSDEAYLNPETQPLGAGRWAFRTVMDDNVATINLGNQVPGMPQYPTAEHAFNIRQQQRQS